MILVMSLQIHTLQASFVGEFLFFTSFVTWMFCKPKVEQKPTLNILVTKTIKEYEQRSGFVPNYVSPQKQIEIAHRNQLAKEAFIHNLLTTPTELQNRPELNNNQIIAQAIDVANRAHAVAYTRRTQIQATPIATQRLNAQDDQDAQLIANAALRFIAENRRRNAEIAKISAFRNRYQNKNFNLSMRPTRQS